MNEKKVSAQHSTAGGEGTAGRGPDVNGAFVGRQLDAVEHPRALGHVWPGLSFPSWPLPCVSVV